MIEVHQLVKKYPGRVAVDGLSFQVAKGEIVGFLGPNGAGKTTTMRILSGFLAASGGLVRVDGHDVTRESMEVRKRIGYLPENCPLYPEMRVDEYLNFRARLKGIGARKVRARVDEVKQLCGLGDVGRRVIGHLSKGFRQRVGLAEALVHDPELLILDEPTIGLDPNQIRQVRELIIALSKRHTILLSTHILPEVEMTCQRALIINKGRIVASDTVASLKGRLEGRLRIRAEVRGPRAEVEAALGQIAGVTGIETRDNGDWSLYTLSMRSVGDARVEIFRTVAARGWELRELAGEEGTLEDVFVQLTRNDPAKEGA